MKLHLLRYALCLVCVGPLAAQNPPAAAQYVPHLTFDTAAIHESKEGNSSYIDNPDDSSYFEGHRLTVQGMVLAAYQIPSVNLLKIGPAWTQTMRFDVQAKSDAATDNILAKLSTKDGRLEKRFMLQRLLAERFKLVIHTETKESTVYEVYATPATAKHMLVVQEDPAHPFFSEENLENPICGVDKYSREGIETNAKACTLKGLTAYLRMLFGTNFIDKTGMKDHYRFQLQWNGTETHFKEGENLYPTLLTAVPEQLGLKLVRAKGPVTSWVVDHVEMPTAN